MPFFRRKPQPTPPTVVAPPAPSSSILFGVATETFAEVPAFETHAGKKVSIYSYYQSFFYDSNFNSALADKVKAHGSTPMITWEAWDPTQGVTQSKYTLRTIINGQLDGYLNRWATQIKAWGGAVLLRPMHEMNGDWYPWSERVNGNNPGDYVRAWRHIRSVFDAAGVTNVQWVWSPNVEFDGTTPLVMLYPGDNVVDWIAIDGYNWPDGWQTPEEIFGPTIDKIHTFTNKPIIIGETGCPEVGGNKRTWIQQFFTMLKTRKIGGFVWFNYNKENDWRIESSPAAQTGFASQIGQL